MVQPQQPQQPSAATTATTINHQLLWPTESFPTKPPTPKTEIHKSEVVAKRQTKIQPRGLELYQSRGGTVDLTLLKAMAMCFFLDLEAMTKKIGCQDIVEKTAEKRRLLNGWLNLFFFVSGFMGFPGRFLGLKPGKQDDHLAR